MKTLLVHGNKGDARVEAFIQRRLEADPKLKTEHGSKDAATPVKLEDAAKFEALVSAELPKVQEIAAAYKAAGISATILGKQGPPPEVKSDDVEVEHPGDAEADPR